MKSLKNNIPNIITSLNLLSGCVACVLSFYGDYTLATYFVLLAAIFDFFDGFAARMLKAYSEIGKELDSLADMISFGMVPGVMLFSFLSSINIVFAFFAFLIPVFSAFRLAKFNIDTRQTSSFIGLPTPANAIFWVFLISNIPNGFTMLLSESNAYYVLIFASILIALSCYMMIAELPMFALKFKNFKIKDNKIRYTFLLLSLILIVLLQLRAFPAIIVLYVFISIITNFFTPTKQVEQEL